MIWAAIAATAALTYGFRVSMLLPSGDRTIAPWVDRAMQGVAPAVIAAMLATEVAGSGESHLPDPAYLIASAAALVTVRRTGQLIHGAAVGMSIVWCAALVGI